MVATSGAKLLRDDAIHALTAGAAASGHGTDAQHSRGGDALRPHHHRRRRHEAAARTISQRLAAPCCARAATRSTTPTMLWRRAAASGSGQAHPQPQHPRHRLHPCPAPSPPTCRLMTWTGPWSGPRPTSRGAGRHAGPGQGSGPMNHMFQSEGRVHGMTSLPIHTVFTKCVSGRNGSGCAVG